MKKLVGVLSAALVVIAGCSSSSGGGQAFTYGDNASTFAALAGCTWQAKPSPTDENTANIDLGPKPLDEGNCTFDDGTTLDVSLYGSTSDQASALMTGESVAASFLPKGTSVWIAQGKGWIAAGENPLDEKGTKDAVKKIADSAGGSVHEIKGTASAEPNAPGSNDSTGDATPSAEQAKAWPVQWCKAEIGMTRDQMRALMGPPSDEFSLDSGTPQMSWDFAEYQFNAFMDVNDQVRQLDVNDIQLTDVERNAIKCEFTQKAK